jgi:membrane fusion protein, multidrug efflux system
MPAEIYFMRLSARQLVLAAGLALALVGCKEGEAQSAPTGPASPAPAVTVATVASREVTPASAFTARVEAVDSVDLRARVSGFLERQLFREGAEVKAGDLLFVLEKGAYQSAVNESKATITRAQASLKLADLEVERQGTLVKRQATAQAKLDEAQAKQGEARGDLLRQEAALEKAMLDLSYTEIKAPLAGRVGRAKYSVGDLVAPESGPLATIVAQDPVYVTFPVTQRQLLEIRRRAAAEGTDQRDVVIRLRLADSSTYPQLGRLDFVDVRVDQGTDTVQVRAEIPNPDRLLIDGQLVTAVVETAKPDLALVIPQQALQADQAGLFVLVVDGEDKVQVRRVEIGAKLEAEIVVAKGLTAGDRVIIEGAQKVRPQQVVQAAEATRG